ncbi:hypothetical protein ACFLW8_06050 [Chloroflexota bacterium]
MADLSISLIIEPHVYQQRIQVVVADHAMFFVGYNQVGKEG